VPEKTGVPAVIPTSATSRPAERAAAEEDDATDEADAQELRDPPDGYASWDKVRTDYELYGPYYDWEDAPETVKCWLSGDDEWRDEFTALNTMGAERVGQLHGFCTTKMVASLGMHCGLWPTTTTSSRSYLTPSTCYYRTSMV
jgi:hypothetical protein